MLVIQNEHFETEYKALYGVFLIFLLISNILFSIWACSKESSKKRKLLPIAMLLASIGELLLILLIIFYFSLGYDHPKVYTKQLDTNPERPGKYKEESKEYYIFAEVIFPIIFLINYLIGYCVVVEWVKRNED